MRHFEDAKKLVEYSMLKIIDIQNEYESCLKERKIKDSFLIEVKNFIENLRSALDYVAQGLFKKYGESENSNVRIYFPYAWNEIVNEKNFSDRRLVDKNIPGLTKNRPDIVQKIISYQHFENKNANAWLPKFMKLTKDAKHLHLTKQIKKEKKQRDVIIDGSPIFSVSNSGKIEIGENCIIQKEDKVIKLPPQIIDENHETKIEGSVEKIEIIITWISFHFESIDEEVLLFLKTSLNGVNKIVTELSEM